MAEPGALAILGPTASGKTAVAVEVARLLDGEIISADSRQLYRGMDVGTAKPTLAERASIPHHGFDMVAPGERYSAGRFARDAWSWIDAIRQRERIPIIAGGTGFFLRALTHPMFDEPALEPSRKEAWKRYLAELPVDRLKSWAAALDPDASIQPQDRQRLARVIEIALLTGRPLSWWQRTAAPPLPAIDPHVFVLDLPRAGLYRRIEARVDAMIDAGLAGEVRALLARGYDESAPGMNATGYIELIPHVRGERTLDDAVAMIKAATRRYARRQLTWLRHQLPPGAAWLSADTPPDELAGVIVMKWSEVMA